MSFISGMVFAINDKTLKNEIETRHSNANSPTICRAINDKTLKNEIETNDNRFEIANPEVGTINDKTLKNEIETKPLGFPNLPVD